MKDMKDMRDLLIDDAIALARFQDILEFLKKGDFEAAKNWSEDSVKYYTERTIKAADQINYPRDVALNLGYCLSYGSDEM